ncbi:MAG: oligosaccharide flippase family protein [Polaribacter sp.]|nr:oligosaccharide flippase family protein [Polaribacter sp.]
MNGLSIIKKSSSLISSQLIKMILQLVSIPILARYVSVQDFGVFAIISAYIGFFQKIKDGGLSLAALQAPTISSSQEKALNTLNVLLGVFFFLISVVLCDYFISFYKLTIDKYLIFILLLSILTSSLSIQGDAKLRRNLNFIYLAKADIFIYVISIFISISMAILDYGILALLSITFIQPILKFITVISKFRIGFNFKFKEIHGFVKFGFTLLAKEILVYIDNFSYSLILGVGGGSKDVIGRLNRSNSLGNIFFANIIPRIIDVMRPYYSISKEKKNVVSDDFWLLIISLISVSFVFFSDILANIILGPNWSEVGVFIKFLVIGFAFDSLIELSQVHDFVNKNGRKIFLIKSFDTIFITFSLILSYYFTNIYIYLFSFPILKFIKFFLQNFYYGKRLKTFKYRTILIVILLVFTPFLSYSTHSLIFSIFISIATYFSIIILFKNEIRNTLQSFRRIR